MSSTPPPLFWNGLLIYIPGPILDSEGMGTFLGAHFLEKKEFWLLATLKQMPFLTILDKNIFFKTQGTRLGVI